MQNEIPGDKKKFKVIINRQKQYSIWPAERENEEGWRTVGKRGSKSECIKYIEEVWTDMRPLDLRKLMGK
jgi:MbtH protein